MQAPAPRRIIALLSAVALLALTASSAVPSAGATPQREPDFARELRPKLIAKMQELRVPGAIVLVDSPSEGRWVTSLGVANLRTGFPMRPDMRMRVGSITKSMTATVILQLVDRGKIGLDDPVSDYLGVVPNGDNISIRQLLNMTSGLFNDTESDELNALLDADTSRVWRPRELLPFSFDEDTYFEPGESFHYANTNYVLLGMIATRVTGEPINRLLHRMIFRPLGMDETLLPRREDASLPRPFAHGYTYGTNVELNDAYKAALVGDFPNAQITRPPDAPPDFDSTFWNTSYTWPDGGAISTVHDLRIWAEALATGSLLSPQTQAERLTPVPGFDYGLGIEFAPFGGFLGHNGAIPGYQSFMGYEPESGTTVIVLASLILGPNVFLGDGLPADEMAKIIAAEVIPA
jgi:D-alanyl-D-alanine carboxypeptidase